MKRAGVLILLLGLTGCATPSTTRLACPVGQAEMRTAQVFLTAKTPALPSDKDIRGFVAAEVSPRFPDGVTVVDGGGQWKGDDNRMIRDAAKVLLIVLPAKGDPLSQVEAVRTAYRTRFNQESVVVLPPPACVVL